jgi:glycogen synthase
MCSSAVLLLLQAGILAADKVLTVSPNYAAEISSGPDKGVELDSVIRMVRRHRITQFDQQTKKSAAGADAL